MPTGQHHINASWLIYVPSPCATWGTSVFAFRRAKACSQSCEFSLVVRLLQTMAWIIAQPVLAVCNKIYTLHFSLKCGERLMPCFNAQVALPYSFCCVDSLEIIPYVEDMLGRVAANRVTVSNAFDMPLFQHLSQLTRAKRDAYKDGVTLLNDLELVEPSFSTHGEHPSTTISIVLEVLATRPKKHPAAATQGPAPASPAIPTTLHFEIHHGRIRWWNWCTHRATPLGMQCSNSVGAAGPHYGLVPGFHRQRANFSAHFPAPVVEKSTSGHRCPMCTTDLCQHALLSNGGPRWWSIARPSHNLRACYGRRGGELPLDRLAETLQRVCGTGWNAQQQWRANSFSKGYSIDLTGLCTSLQT